MPDNAGRLKERKPDSKKDNRSEQKDNWTVRQERKMHAVMKCLRNYGL
jgi:hypothetical protein